MPEYQRDTKVIGFDLDQTLYPKSPEIDHAIQEYCYIKIATHRHVPLSEAKNLFEERYKNGKGLGGTATLKDLGIPDAFNIIQEALERADIAKFLAPDQHVRSLLIDLRDRYKNIDLVTGSNLKNTLSKLDKLEIPFELFSHAITGDDGSKSNGEAYKIWLSLYSMYQPEHFLYIGDRPGSDYEVPKSLGIRSILVNIKSPDPDINCLQLPSIVDLQSYL
jgi:FMN phosphatase YigB (HAD superfamily)